MRGNEQRTVGGWNIRASGASRECQNGEEKGEKGDIIAVPPTKGQCPH